MSKIKTFSYTRCFFRRRKDKTIEKFLKSFAICKSTKCWRINIKNCCFKVLTLFYSCSHKWHRQYLPSFFLLYSIFFHKKMKRRVINSSENTTKRREKSWRWQSVKSNEEHFSCLFSVIFLMIMIIRAFNAIKLLYTNSGLFCIWKKRQKAQKRLTKVKLWYWMDSHCLYF